MTSAHKYHIGDFISILQYADKQGTWHSVEDVVLLAAGLMADFMIFMLENCKYHCQQRHQHFN